MIKRVLRSIGLSLELPDIVIGIVVVLLGLTVLLGLLWGIAASRRQWFKLAQPLSQQLNLEQPLAAVRTVVTPYRGWLIAVIAATVVDLLVLAESLPPWLAALEVCLSFLLAVSVTLLGFKLFSALFDTYVLGATLEEEAKINTELLTLGKFVSKATIVLVVTLLGVVTVRQALEDPPTAPTASRETDRIQTPPRELPRKSAPAPDEPELREEESVPEAQPAPPASGGGDPSGPDPSDADAERARSQDSSGDPGEDAPAAAKATAQAPTREAARVVLPSPDPSVPPAADAPGSAPPSLRDRFRRAQAAAGTDAEADALAALVVALETTPAPATLPLRDADDAVGKARRQFTAAPPAATTLADSVVVHLSSRLGVFIDSAQRERAQRQLRRFGRE